MIHINSCLAYVRNGANECLQSTQMAVSTALRTLAERVHSFFRAHGHVLMNIAACALSAYFSPPLFFSGMAVGMVGTLLLNYLNGAQHSTTAFLLEKTYDVFLIQATLTTVSAISKIVEAANSQFFGGMSRDGIVSCLLSGILAGSSVIALARNIPS